MHTPGPWSVCGDGACSCKTVTCADYPVAVVTSGEWGDTWPSVKLVGESSLSLKAEAFLDKCVYGEVPEETARANARLIAAAPDLLYHAKTVLFHLRRGDHTEPRAVSQMIDSLAGVVAKAAG